MFGGLITRWRTTISLTTLLSLHPCEQDLYFLDNSPQFICLSFSPIVSFKNLVISTFVSKVHMLLCLSVEAQPNLIPVLAAREESTPFSLSEYFGAVVSSITQVLCCIEPVR